MKKLVLFLFTAVAGLNLNAQVTNYTVGQTVADFTVTDTDGVTRSLYSITAGGQYVMLDFFFDTCPPCQATQPFYNELHETYGCNAGQLFVMSINNGTDSDAEVIAFENTYGGTFEHSPAVSSQGGGGTVTSQFGISAFPTYCLIGPDNKLVNADIWPISNMSTFVAAFPANSGIQPMACSSNVSESVEAVEVSIFPVPATNHINIMSDMGANATFTIYGLLGQAVKTGNLRQSNVQVDISDLSEGQYILEVLGNRETVRKAFTVVR